MKTITAMREEIAGLMKQLGDMKATCETENREPNESELGISKEILDRIDELGRIIANEERINATQKRLDQPVGDPIKPDIGTDNPAQEKIDRFLTLGEQMMAVRTAGAPGGSVDIKLRTAEITGLGETVASDGGFLVQQEFSTEMLRNLFATGLLAPKCKTIEIGAGKNGVQINGIDETSRVTGSRWGGVIAYWETEAGQKPATKPKFRQIDLKLKKLVGLCYATDDVLEDAVALESWIRMAFNDEFNFQIDLALISGTGAGVPLGILNSPCLVSVAKETNQAAKTVLYKNVAKMWARMVASSRANAIWLINQDVEPQLQFMDMPVGTGGLPVYLPPGGASAEPYSRLFGRPVLPIEQCETLGTKGDIMIADYSQYLLAKKGTMKVDMSIHVRFIYDESVFRFVLRIDGQPMRASAITPFKGTDTLSSFVALNVRA